MISIIDYKMGNVGSIKNMLSRIGVESVITSDYKVIQSSKGIILPGVGGFDKAMTNLSQMDILPLLNSLVINDKKPILGICLGMQIMARNSEEGKMPGLGWIDAEIKKFRFKDDNINLKIPHMGWNEIIEKKESEFLKNMYNNSRFYFVHSYHMISNKQDDILTSTSYGYEFVSAIEKGNIIGVQFHPEKSHKYGMRLLENFSKIL
jgi:glutamine amidotransferase